MRSRYFAYNFRGRRCGKSYILQYLIAIKREQLLKVFEQEHAGIIALIDRIFDKEMVLKNERKFEQ